MSDTISLEWIGGQLRAIQAEQRTLRMENELFRKELGRLHGAMATRELVGEVLTVLVDRIGNFEALSEARIDQLGGRIDQLGGRIDQFGGRLEAWIDQLDGRFDQLGGKFDQLGGRLDARIDRLAAQLDRIEAIPRPGTSSP